MRKFLSGALLGTLALSCGSETAGPPADLPPVFVIGMDGLEWNVLKPLLDAGRLPHFQALIDRGIAGGLQTFQPTFSPVVWTSIATGMPREKHGILNFSEEVNGRMKPGGLPYTSNTRQVPAVWNIASDYQRTVLSVGWWVSWPAEPVNGRVVASYAAQAQGQVFWKAGVWEDGLPELTYPEELVNDITGLLRRGGPTGPLRAGYDQAFEVIPGEARRSPQDPADPWEFPRVRDSFFRIGYHGDRTHLEIFKQQLGVEVADLNMVYFGLTDVAGHFWWRYYQPEEFNYSIPEDHLALLQARLDASYEMADAWLGELLAAAPENARILVVSDHGMHAANRNNPDHPQSGAHEDAPPGVLIAAGPGIQRRGLLPETEWRFPIYFGGRETENVLQAPQRLGGVYDITPTILHWLGIPSGADMAGAPLFELVEPDGPLAAAPTAIPSHGQGFRAPTPPRVPRTGMNEDFQRSFLDVLGYQDSVDQQLENDRDSQNSGG